MSGKAEAISCMRDTESGVNRVINKSGRRDDARFVTVLLFSGENGPSEREAAPLVLQTSTLPSSRLHYSHNTENTPPHYYSSTHTQS